MNSSEHIQVVVDFLGGIATRQQLVERGFTGFQLTAAVRWGTIRRIRRGWYASSIANYDATLAVRIGGRLSHISAARHYELWTGLDTTLHLTVTRGASRLRQASFESPRVIDIHWICAGRQQLTGQTSWVVSLEDCLRGVVRSSDEETAIACLDTAITLYGYTAGDLASMFALEPVESRRRAAEAKDGSDSGTESIARQRFERLGFLVEQQVNLRGIGWVDMILNGKLVVEIDGFEHHSTRKSKNEDYRRDAELTARNVPHLRFSYTQVMFEWEFVEASVRATLAVS